MQRPLTYWWANHDSELADRLDKVGLTGRDRDDLAPSRWLQPDHQIAARTAGRWTSPSCSIAQWAEVDRRVVHC